MEGTLPADVRFTYVPAVFTTDDAFARAYFAAETLGALARTHDAMFRAIHDDRMLPTQCHRRRDRRVLRRSTGVDPAKFKAAMPARRSTAKLQRAREFALRSGVEGTPTLIVNGRYRVRGRIARRHACASPAS